MKNITVVPGVYWVGAVDWHVRNFHGHTYHTRRGTTYNSYLIVDDKITLVDTVHKPYAGDLIRNIKEITDPAEIDYIIINHIETDHSGALQELLAVCPRAKVFGTARTKDGLKKQNHLAPDFSVVKTGDTLSLGKKTLSFIEAPMIHWPDSMFTYMPEDALLLPNDAFGQHYASSERFDDEVDVSELMDEAVKYYANILWPLSGIIAKKLDDVKKMNVPIKIIAPSHGVIWRSSPDKIMNAYASWSKHECKGQAVVVFETMWGATARMAQAIARGISDEGVSVSVCDVTQADRTEVIKKLFESSGWCFGSSTHDNDMLPGIAGFLHFLKGLKPKNRVASVFGSYGWAGGAIKEIERILASAGLASCQESLGIQYDPDDEGLKKSYEFGRIFAKNIKNRKEQTNG